MEWRENISLFNSIWGKKHVDFVTNRFQKKDVTVAVSEGEINVYTFLAILCDHFGILLH